MREAGKGEVREGGVREVGRQGGRVREGGRGERGREC